MFSQLFYEYFFGPIISALIMMLFILVTQQANIFASYVKKFIQQRKQRLEHEAKWKRVQAIIDLMPEPKANGVKH